MIFFSYLLYGYILHDDWVWGYFYVTNTHKTTNILIRCYLKWKNIPFSWEQRKVYVRDHVNVVVWICLCYSRTVLYSTCIQYIRQIRRNRFSCVYIYNMKQYCRRWQTPQYWFSFGSGGSNMKFVRHFIFLEKSVQLCSNNQLEHIYLTTISLLKLKNNIFFCWL